MKKSAISLVLIMLTGSLAGCLAGDSDGVPEISLTDEDISGLFDDYFMDFVNNSSVTVVNEIHYHNNTTIVEGDDSSTNSVVYNSNGTSGSDYPYYILDVTLGSDSFEEDPVEAPDYSSVFFNATWYYYDFSSGGYRNGEFSVSCGNYYLFVGLESSNNSSGFLNNRSFWENSSYYYDAWLNIHNQTIIDILQNFASETYVQSTCGASHYVQNNQDLTISYDYSIEIPEGFVLSCVGAVNNEQSYQLTTFYRSEYFDEDYYGEGVNDGTWRVYGGNNLNRVSDSNGQRWSEISLTMTVDEFPHICQRFAGNGEQSEFRLTVTYDVAFEVRVLFYYQLIPIQTILTTE